MNPIHDDHPPLVGIYSGYPFFQFGMDSPSVRPFRYIATPLTTDLFFSLEHPDNSCGGDLQYVQFDPCSLDYFLQRYRAFATNPYEGTATLFVRCVPGLFNILFRLALKSGSVRRNQTGQKLKEELMDLQRLIWKKESLKAKVELVRELLREKGEFLRRGESLFLRAYWALQKNEYKVKVPDLAKQLHYCEGHFRRLLKQETGYCPTQFIDLVRMNDLLGRAMPTFRGKVKDLGSTFGFSSPDHFSRKFKSWIGMPPGEYLRRIHTLK